MNSCKSIKLTSDMSDRWQALNRERFDRRRNQLIADSRLYQPPGDTIKRERPAFIHGQLYQTCGLIGNEDYNEYVVQSGCTIQNQFDEAEIFRKIIDIYQRTKQPVKVLDAGFGRGLALLDIALSCQRLNVPVQLTGIDCFKSSFIPPQLLNREKTADLFGNDLATWKKAEELFILALRSQTITLSYGTIEALPSQWANFFDLVFCIQIMQYVKDPVAAFSELHRVIAPQGEGMITVGTLPRYISGELDPFSWKRNIIPALRSFGWEITLKDGTYSKDSPLTHILKQSEIALQTGLIYEPEASGYISLPIPQEFETMIPSFTDFRSPS